MRGQGTIENLRLGKDSPIAGYVVGSTRPLEGLGVPGARALDKLMESFQRNAVPVRIRGTLGEPETKAVPFQEVSSALRTLIWGQMRRQNSSGR